MKVLVTGGAGFIGSHIVDLLIERGHSVIVLDDLSTGSFMNLNAAAKFYQMSINDAKLDGVFAEELPDMVCHQAAHTVVTESVKDPVHDATTNITGSLNLLARCSHYGCRRVVYASSCAIYGDPEYLPVDEAHSIRPASPYGISKHTVEHYLQVYHSLYGLEYIALRYANVFGPRQNTRGEAGVIALFSRKMLAGEQPTIYGDGGKTRAYVFVKDVARANALAIEAGGKPHAAYNIGTSEETTDQAVFDTLAGELGYTFPAQYAPVRPGEIKRMALDCRRAGRELGWAPAVGFREGISQTALSYRVMQCSGIP